jgi:hypothetical protein
LILVASAFLASSVEMVALTIVLAVGVTHKLADISQRVAAAPIAPQAPSASGV